MFSRLATGGRSTLLCCLIVLGVTAGILALAPVMPAQAAFEAGTCASGSGTFANFDYEGPYAWEGGTIPPPPEPAGAQQSDWHAYAVRPIISETPCHAYGANGDGSNYYLAAHMDSGTWTPFPSSAPVTVPAGNWRVWRLTYGSAGYPAALGVAEPSAPKPCDDGTLANDDAGFGGYGGGGSWGGGPDGAEDNSDGLFGKVFWSPGEGPLDAAWYLYDNLTTKLFGPGNVEVNKDEVGFGSYGGGGVWAVGCDLDDDAQPDPDPTTTNVYVYITNPPPDDPAPPAGGCDFGILDPSSWLCSLAGMVGKLLDAIKAVLRFLWDLGKLLVALFVPDGDVLQGKFADVDTAWDASGPGQLTGGVATVADPLLNLSDGTPTSCEGPQFTLPLPMAKNVTINPLSSCSTMAQYVLGLLLPLEAALVYIGGFFLALRIVTKPFGMDTPGTNQAAAA